jgi:hypothetical protein
MVGDALAKLHPLISRSCLRQSLSRSRFLDPCWHFCCRSGREVVGKFFVEGYDTRVASKSVSASAKQLLGAEWTVFWFTLGRRSNAVLPLPREYEHLA